MTAGGELSTTRTKHLVGIPGKGVPSPDLARWTISAQLSRIRTPDDAFELLRRLGATPWLIRHHQLVLEAADEILAGLDVTVDRAQVRLGAALHDVGKVLHPREMSQPGHAHEAAGEALLRQHGVPAEIARFAVSHAGWSEASPLEDLLVALADKLWKGRREDSLEKLVLARLAGGRPEWEVFAVLDALCERVAAGGEDRLARSQV